MKTCILIPTYNNASTLPEVLRKVLPYSLPVFVVNDGSTDGTASILREFALHKVITLKRNCGKGFALCTGFREAYLEGFQRAITIDSDLQHDPADIPKFLNAGEKHPHSLIIGARFRLREMGAPLANRVGNTLSNLYFMVLTGRWLPDTQSGYRSYPLSETLSLNCPPSRYEFEFVVLVAASRAGLELVSIPIKVAYNKERYVSHFQPFRDFFRIFWAGLKSLGPSSRGNAGGS